LSIPRFFFFFFFTEMLQINHFDEIQVQFASDYNKFRELCMRNANTDE